MLTTENATTSEYGTSHIVPGSADWMTVLFLSLKKPRTLFSGLTSDEYFPRVSWNQSTFLVFLYITQAKFHLVTHHDDKPGSLKQPTGKN